MTAGTGFPSVVDAVRDLIGIGFAVLGGTASRAKLVSEGAVFLAASEARRSSKSNDEAQDRETASYAYETRAGRPPQSDLHSSLARWLARELGPEGPRRSSPRRQ